MRVTNVMPLGCPLLLTRCHRKLCPNTEGTFCRQAWHPCLQAPCAFSDRNFLLRMPLVPTPVRLQLVYACEQWHSSRVATFLPVRTVNYI
jgi:hypothetical protein